VITVAFEREAEVQCAALGMAGLRPVVIDHPLSTITDGEIAARVRQVVEQAPRVWKG
jgi:hypothetical protein